MNQLNIQVQIKHIYGNETIYPVCEKAKNFAALLGQKTLTMRDIHFIKALGYAILVIQEKVAL